MAPAPQGMAQPIVLVFSLPQVVRDATRCAPRTALASWTTFPVIADLGNTRPLQQTAHRARPFQISRLPCAAPDQSAQYGWDLSLRRLPSGKMSRFPAAMTVLSQGLRPSCAAARLPWHYRMLTTENEQDEWEHQGIGWYWFARLPEEQITMPGSYST